MKLAEALSLRKDLNARIENLKELLSEYSQVQEGDEPAEKPETLISELNECLKQLEHYVYWINVTNMNVKDEDGKDMTRLLAERDVLKKRIEVLNYTFRHVTDSGSRRFSRNEIKTVVTIDMKALRSKISQLSQQYRQLDSKIQAMNYTYDLMTS